MDHQENNDPVWKLLSHARKTEPSPFFSRNVVREVRLIQSGRSAFWTGFTHWLSNRPLVAGAAACVAIVITIIVFFESWNHVEQGIASSPYSEAGPETFDPASEMASIEYLGQLMAVADPGQLNDAALADLFY